MTLVRSSLYALAQLLLTPPYALVVLLLSPLPRRARWYVISGWARVMLRVTRWLCGVRWTVEGRDRLPAGPAVILSKHQSAWETLAFQSIFPPQVYLLKRELLWIPFFGWGLALMSPIAIDRAKGRVALKTLARQGRERLAQGFWIVVYPEGTRMAPGKRGKYQLGGAWLAVQAAVPVVPVAHNAGLLWPRNGFMKRAGLVTVRIGPAIATAGRRAEEVNAEAEAWIEGQQKALCPSS